MSSSTKQRQLATIMFTDMAGWPQSFKPQIDGTNADNHVRATLLSWQAGFTNWVNPERARNWFAIRVVLRLSAVSVIMFQKYFTRVRNLMVP